MILEHTSNVQFPPILPQYVDLQLQWTVKCHTRNSCISEKGKTLIISRNHPIQGKKNCPLYGPAQVLGIPYQS